jgi:hypothetical protein
MALVRARGALIVYGFAMFAIRGWVARGKTAFGMFCLMRFKFRLTEALACRSARVQQHPVLSAACSRTEIPSTMQCAMVRCLSPCSGSAKCCFSLSYNGNPLVDVRTGARHADGRLSVFAWCSRGVRVVFAWCSRGVRVVFAWCSRGVRVVFAWCSRGVRMVFA